MLLQLKKIQNVNNLTNSNTINGIWLRIQIIKYVLFNVHLMIISNNITVSYAYIVLRAIIFVTPSFIIFIDLQLLLNNGNVLK